MPSGLQVFNPSQVPVLDTEHFVGKFGTVATFTQGTNGSATVALGSTETLAVTIDEPSDYSLPSPTVTVSGGDITWTWDSGTSVSSREIKLLGMIF